MRHRPLLRRLLCPLLMLALLSCLTACGGEDPSADRTYTLSLTMHDSLTSSIGMIYAEWANAVSEATDGHVQIKLYCSGTLASGTEAVDFVKFGSADIGWIYTAFYPGRFPLTEVVSIPMSGISTPAQTAEILWDLYEETPELQEELSDFKILMMYGNPVNFISTADAPLTEPADLQGLSLRCPSGGVARVLQKLGVNTIQMNSNDIYESLEKGIIDGTVHEWNGISTFSLSEQLNYYMDMPLYEGVFLLAMNLDSWNSLPAEYQRAIEDLSLREGSVQVGERFSEGAMEHKDTILAAGGELVTPGPALIAAFENAAAEYAQEWVEERSTDSFDAAAYYARMLELSDQYSGEVGA